MYTIFRLENLNAADRSEDLDIDGKVIERILGKWGGETWTGCIWLSGF